VTIEPDPARELRLAAVPQAIRRGGFVPEALAIRARGRYESEDGQPRFRIRGWKAALPVDRSGLPPEGEVTLRARVEVADAGVRLRPVD